MCGGGQGDLAQGEGVSREGVMGREKPDFSQAGWILGSSIVPPVTASGSVNRTFVTCLHSQVLCQEFGLHVFQSVTKTHEVSSDSLQLAPRKLIPEK